MSATYQELAVYEEAVTAPSDPTRPTKDPQTNVQRFKAVSVAATLAASIPYLWALWDLWTGTINPLRVDGEAQNMIYDVQARAIMHGHLWLPTGKIGIEAFVRGGHDYTYFGIFPSLLRVPIFLFTDSLDGRFTALSILGAWVVTALFSSLLLWRLRILLRGDAPLGWSEATSYGVLLASLLGGSVLLYLAALPKFFSEDLAWSVALACASLFALVGVLERPSWRRVWTCGILVLLTNLNRSTTGYPAVLAALLIAIWFALGRGGSDRRRWAFPMAVAALVPLAIGCAINLMKFDLLFGVPFQDQLVFQLFDYRHLNGGQYVSLRYLPSTLQAYLDPSDFRVSSVFPYITLADVPGGPIAHTSLFDRQPTASAPLSMPLLFVSGLWGVITTFTPGRLQVLRAMRLLLVTSAATAGTVLVWGWIYERYEADFMPLLLLAAMIGMIDVWRRLDGRSRRTRTFVPTAIGVLALWGLWANMGFASTPNDGWTPAQLTHYVNAELAFSNFTGHPLDHHVIVTTRPPEPAPMGTLFIQGRCDKLFIAWRAVRPKFAEPTSSDYLRIEQGRQMSLCHSLLNEIRPQQ